MGSKLNVLICTQTHEYMKVGWLNFVVDTITTHLKKIPHSCYNIDEREWNVYEMSKISNYLRLVKFLMRVTGIVIKRRKMMLLWSWPDVRLTAFFCVSLAGYPSFHGNGLTCGLHGGDSRTYGNCRWSSDWRCPELRLPYLHTTTSHPYPNVDFGFRLDTNWSKLQ